LKISSGDFGLCLVFGWRIGGVPEAVDRGFLIKLVIFWLLSHFVWNSVKVWV
jgi:hypothetical protein